jgi:two-component system chemotaxis sensor kinase CheA
LKATGSEPANDNSGLIAKLDLLAQFGADNAKAAASQEAANPTPAAVPEPPLAAAPKIEQAVEAPVAAQPAPTEEAPLESASVNTTTSEDVPVTQEQPAEPGAKNEKKTEGGPKRKSVADLSIWVNADVLDSLTNLVGELVLTRNQLLQLARGDD